MNFHEHDSGGGGLQDTTLWVRVEYYKRYSIMYAWFLTGYNKFNQDKIFKSRQDNFVS